MKKPTNFELSINCNEYNKSKVKKRVILGLEISTGSGVPRQQCSDRVSNIAQGVNKSVNDLKFIKK